jgi:predicted Zn-dependent protease
MEFEPRQIPEGINTTKEHPVKEMFILLAGVFSVAAVIFLFFILIADYLVRFIPLETEQQWFDLSRLQFIQKETSSKEVQAVESYLQTLVQQLKQTQSEPVTFTIQLMDSDVPNAFITPGGHIFLTRDLFRYVDSENALAMVIAHEMAHQYHRHPIRTMGRHIVISMALMLFIGVDGSDWVSSILAESVKLGLLAYSRDQERQADETGVRMLKDLYGHAGGSSSFFEHLHGKDELRQSGFSEYLSTHPNTDERLAYFQKLDNKNAIDLKPLPASVRQLMQSNY